MTRVALITGVTGQDGSYLAELLLENGYEVHGLVRRASTANTARIAALSSADGETGLHLHHGDLSDESGLRTLIGLVKPDEVYNLGGQTQVQASWEQAVYTAEVSGVGTLRLLEAVRLGQDAIGKEIRFYQASSSEIFGSAPPPQSLATPVHPRSPYACAKLFGHWQTINHRESYGMYACSGVLFNHESPRRGENFVTRKITRAVGRIALGLQDKLYLGNLDVKRDRGHARDYVESMYLMLQQERPADFIIASGQAHSVREFAQHAFAVAGLDAEEFIEIDPRFFRPAEGNYMLGDVDGTFEALGWRPKTSFEDLVREMVEADLELARREKILAESGLDYFLTSAGHFLVG